MLLANDRNNGMSLLLVILIALSISVAAIAVLTLELKWGLILFLAILFPFVIPLIGNLKHFFMGIMLFALPLQIDLHLFQKASIGGADSIKIGVFEIVLFIAVIHWIIESAQSKQHGTLKLFPMITVPSLLLIFASGISLIAAKDLTIGFYDIIDMVKVLIFFLYLTNNINNQNDLIFLLKILFLAILFQAVVFFLEFYKGIVLPLPGYRKEVLIHSIFVGEQTKAVRPGGTIGSVNSLARYLLYIVPIALAFSVTSSRIKHKWLPFLATLGGLVIIMMSLTRSVWISFTFSILVIYLFLWFRHLMSLKLFRNTLVVCGFGIMVLFAYGDVLYDRLTSYDYGSAKVRITTAKVALKMIEDYPLLGVGINNYESHLEKYWLQEDPFTRNAAVHNNYLLYFSETGVLGFCALLILMMAVFFSIYRAISSSRVHIHKIISIGLMGSFTGFVISSFADHYKGNEVLLYMFWCIAAISEAIYALNQKYRDQTFHLLENGRWLREF